MHTLTCIRYAYAYAYANMHTYVTCKHAYANFTVQYPTLVEPCTKRALDHQCTRFGHAAYSRLSTGPSGVRQGMEHQSSCLLSMFCLAVIVNSFPVWFAQPEHKVQMKAAAAEQQTSLLHEVGGSCVNQHCHAANENTKGFHQTSLRLCTRTGHRPCNRSQSPS